MSTLDRLLSAGKRARDAGGALIGRPAAARGWQPTGVALAAGEIPQRIIPGPPPSSAGDEESLDVWGFKDTAFAFDSGGAVTLTGSRYELCGDRLPNLVPWIGGVMEVHLEPRDENKGHYPPKIPAPLANEGFNDAIRDFLAEDQITADPAIRLRHGHGQTQEEMYAIKYGALPRVPDLVVYPSEEEHVTKLVDLARSHNISLIPYGGGTNVTDALRCPEAEQRTIVSVDMRRMNRILWIDPANRMACIQAGAVGRHIVKQLADYGFTMGHEPDSIEFSTLGGWIATHASGMKKNKYGNIEELVLDFNVVTAHGTLSRVGTNPRESVGADPRRWIFGSEGNLGIITQAVVKLFPVPQVQTFGSILFPDFRAGVAFLYDLQHEGKPPASVRLVDNAQFQLSMALKPEKTGLAVQKSRLESLIVTKIKGFDPDRMVACTLVFEGNADEVAHEERQLYDIAARHGGMKAGGANGRKGYQLTFGIAYIRDFVMKHYVIAESFETSVPWSQAIQLADNTKRRVYREHAARNLPGKPFVTCRVTQVYQTGVCIYFYLAFYYNGVENPSKVFAEIEHAARDEILNSGGSLSHHHGIGKLREGFLPRIMSEPMLDWNARAKAAVDPDNIFGAGNQRAPNALQATTLPPAAANPAPKPAAKTAPKPAAQTAPKTVASAVNKASNGAVNKPKRAVTRKKRAPKSPSN